MKKIIYSLGLMLFAIVVNAQNSYRIVLIGGSSAESSNQWFEIGCEKLDAQAVNKAVTDESIVDAANRLHAGALYSSSELETMDALVIMYNQNQSVYDESQVQADHADYSLPFTNESHYAAAYDYVIKKYLSDCYNLKNDPNSAYYNIKAGKPAIIVLCTNWHDGTETLNSSIRQLAVKWGITLIEFDKNSGFSKNQLHPVTQAQYSLIFAPDAQEIAGVAYGLHPLKGRYSYIQQKMAAIFTDCLVEILP
jgi:hypothetical protein